MSAESILLEGGIDYVALAEYLFAVAAFISALGAIWLGVQLWREHRD